MRTEFSSQSVLKRAIEDFRQRLQSGGLVILTELAELASRPLVVADLDRDSILEAVTASHCVLAASAEFPSTSRGRQLVLEATAGFYGKRNWDDLCGAIPKTTEHLGHYFIEVIGSGATASACVDGLSLQLPRFTADEPGSPDRLDSRRAFCDGNLTRTRRVAVKASKEHPTVVLTFCAYGKTWGEGTAETFRAGELLGSRTMPRMELLSTIEDGPENALLELFALIARHVRNGLFAIMVDDIRGSRTYPG